MSTNGTPPLRTSDYELLQKYLERTRALLAGIDVVEVQTAVGALRAARERGATIFVIGNGGSAAAASHFATDLNKATRRADQPSMRVISLADSTAWMTALANDEGYENTFRAQLENLLVEDDVVVAVSASGSSPNVVNAVRYARLRRAVSIALVGFGGGDLVGLADVVVHVRSSDRAYGPVEDAHVAIQHAITACLSDA